MLRAKELLQEAAAEQRPRTHGHGCLYSSLQSAYLVWNLWSVPSWLQPCFAFFSVRPLAIKPQTQHIIRTKEIRGLPPKLARTDPLPNSHSSMRAAQAASSVCERMHSSVHVCERVYERLCLCIKLHVSVRQHAAAHRRRRRLQLTCTSTKRPPPPMTSSAN